jgi:hypothetical protein
MRFGDEKRSDELHVKLVYLNRKSKSGGLLGFGMIGKLPYHGTDNHGTMMRCDGTWKIRDVEWMDPIMSFPMAYAEVLRDLLDRRDFPYGPGVVNIATPPSHNHNL